jgi:signal peptidase
VSTAWQRLTVHGIRPLPTVATGHGTARRPRLSPLTLAQAAAALHGRIPAVPPRVRRILGLTANATLVGAALIIVGALAVSLTPRLLGYSSVIVYGGSMAGSVRVGSIAVTKEVQPEDIRVGDVIVFYPPTTSPNRSPLMHRVISVREEDGQRLFSTKGDANATPDPWEIAVEGRGSRVAYAVPYVGYLVDFAGTPLGWALLLFLPATYLGVTTLRRIWAGERSAR